MMVDEILLPSGASLSDVAGLIESWVEGESLRVISRGPLATFPGSIQWRLKRGTEAGLLEITLLNRERRVELSIPPNRGGQWTGAALEGIASVLHAKYPLPPVQRKEGA